jgi:hypothetical protein
VRYFFRQSVLHEFLLLIFDFRTACVNAKTVETTAPSPTRVGEEWANAGEQREEDFHRNAQGIWQVTIGKRAMT